jgi:hypothetical protein
MDKRLLLAVGAVSLGLIAWPLLVAPAMTAQQAPGWPPAIVTLSSPTNANAGEPQLTVSDRGVLLSWIERNGSRMTLRFAERTATGWTEPRTVAAGDDWSVNAVDVPSVLRLADGTLVANWLQKSGSGMHANDVRLSYSKDDGRTWAASFKPHRDNAPNERGFVSLFGMPDGGLGLIWLDGPAMSPDTGHSEKAASDHARGGDHAGHQQGGRQGHGGRGGEHGPMGVRRDLTVRFAAFDTAWKQAGELTVDPRVCECCPTAAASTSEGVLVAYRNRSDDEIRDIYVARLEQGKWSEPAAVHADNWRIPRCPVNGPALSASGRNVAIAWYTVKEEQGRAFAAFSRDAGRSFGTPIRLDDGGSIGRVDIQVLADGSALATWIEMADGRGQFRARRVTTDGERSTPVTVATLAGGRAGGSPRVARHGAELVLAWTETESGASQLRTATVRLTGSMTR